MKIGVSQGFMPGILLFIMHRDELNESLTMLETIHFADDSTFYLDIYPSTDDTFLISSVPNTDKCKLVITECKKTNYAITLKINQILNIKLHWSGQL